LQLLHIFTYGDDDDDDDDVLFGCYSYLVCSMYEEAASLASTILKQQQSCLRDVDDNDDMLQSTAMVLLQAFNHLGRHATPISHFSNIIIIIILIIINVCLLLQDIRNS
jgi:hypothetical protein